MSTWRRRRTLAAGAAGCLAVALIMGASPALSLTGSTFESEDGNKPVNTTGNQDWDQLTTASLETNQPDTPSGPDDESFTQGTKSDSPVPTIESGSIPPNKSDLTRMYVASETVAGEVILYVAWERSNTLGSANMNFEFNKATDGLTTNGVTPIRLAGDVLITFDFANGGNHVDLGLARWAQGTCVANGAKAPDCWGGFLDLDAAGFADGAVSEDGRFGEAAINLTDAGVFAPNQCTALGSAYLTSRSSDSFTAALKDFVPPDSISIATCGAFKIIKTAKHKGTTANPAPNLEATFDVKVGETVYRSVKTNSTTGVICVPEVRPGSYTVVETGATQTGYALDTSVENVTVSLTDTCDTKSVSFENVPKSKVTVTFESLVPGGTAASISCSLGGTTVNPDAGADAGDATTPVTFDDLSEVYGALLPGVYTCTINVDP